MRNRLIALAAILGIAALIAAPVAGAGTTGITSGGSSGGGGGGHSSSGGGSGAGHGGGSGGGHGGGGGGHFGSGGFGRGHFGGGHFVGNGGYRGGFGGSAAHANDMTRGGYVAHGSYRGQRGYIAHGDYRIVGAESAGLVHVDTALRGGSAGRITLAPGPRMGSAAKALRLDRKDGMGRTYRAHGRLPAHPHPPKRPHHRRYFPETTHESTQEAPPPFCDFNVPVAVTSPRDEMAFGCPGAIREPVRTRLGLLHP